MQCRLPFCQISERHGIATILTERDTPLDKALHDVDGWSVVEEDAGLRLWVTAPLASGAEPP